MLLQRLRQNHELQLGPGALVSKICVRLLPHSLRVLSHSASSLTTINDKTEKVTQQNSYRVIRGFDHLPYALPSVITNNSKQKVTPDLYSARSKEMLSQTLAVSDQCREGRYGLIQSRKGRKERRTGRTAISSQHGCHMAIARF